MQKEGLSHCIRMRRNMLVVEDEDELSICVMPAMFLSLLPPCCIVVRDLMGIPWVRLEVA